MMAAVGLADLVRLFAARPASEHRASAELIGFRQQELPPARPEAAPGHGGIVDTVIPTTSHDDVSAESEAGMMFWRVEAATEHGAPPAPPTGQGGLTRDDLESPGRAMSSTPPTTPLAPWPQLVGRVGAALAGIVESREVEASAIARSWARGRWLGRLPRRMRRTWAAHCSVWIDRSARLVPFWRDQDAVCRDLVRLCGPAGIRFRCIDDARQASLGEHHGDLLGAASLDPGAPVLVLGDLGFHGEERDRARWLVTAHRLRRGGVPIAALVPASSDRWDPRLAAAWNAMAWERSTPPIARGDADARAASLLRLIAPTALAQPGLVRALRRLLPATDADASTEVDVWRHPDVLAADLTGLVLERRASARWRAEFATRVPTELQERVRALIDDWHRRLPAELLHAETLAWIAWGLAAPPGDEAEALAFAGRLEATLCDIDTGDDRAELAQDYGRHLLGAVPDSVYHRLPGLKRVWSVAFADVEGAQRPTTIGPDEVFDRDPTRPARSWSVEQRGDRLLLVPMGGAWSGAGTGSRVATIAAGRPMIRVGHPGQGPTQRRLVPEAELVLDATAAFSLETDLATVSLGVWGRQPWASAAGRDRYGLWAAFEVEGVRQRMRWIPPGRFLMGSPEGEAGRYEDEGPQHLVTITAGYWLGEMPVTQALWRAVMGDNPSRFVSDERPVEQVSWNDCQAFIERVNARLDGARAALPHGGERLRLRMPTEAEWERACRAGTTTATWVGDLTIEGANNAPLLDDIAWYGGNSGVGFELDNGHDSSGWPDKQHPHTRAGTHPVGAHDPEPRRPNPYGLHDMLGNVYEWCQDAGKGYAEPYAYTAEPVTDPVHEQGPLRVNRGGSWSSGARFVRAAYRYATPPDFAYDFLGFRLAGGQAALGKQAGEPRSGEGGEPRSGGASAPRSGGGGEPRSGERGRGAGRAPARAEERDATTPGDSRPPSGAARTTTVTTHDGPRGRRRR